MAKKTPSAARKTRGSAPARPHPGRRRAGLPDDGYGGLATRIPKAKLRALHIKCVERGMTVRAAVEAMVDRWLAGSS